jgi:hypothetical protein
MPHYPSTYNGIQTSSTYNNIVTRRLAVKDRVAFATSTRFGGQYIEPKGVPNPYNGTIIDAQGAVTELLQELNLAQTLIPDLGNTTLLSYVGVATNVLSTYNGIGVSYIGSQSLNVFGATGGISTAVGKESTLQFDGVNIGTSLRVLYYGLTTSAMNGVYTVGSGTTNGTGPLYYYLTRSSDMNQWWQFAKPKAFLANNGTTNKANVFYLNTDAWETGNSFSLVNATAPGVLASNSNGSYTGIAFTYTNTPGLTNVFQGGFLTSLVNNNYTGSYAVGEYNFLAQDSMAKFIHLKNRARRLAYQVFKFRENYTPYAVGTAAGNNIIGSQYNAANGVNTGITVNNIGYSTANNLSAGSKYPSSFFRGF